MSTEHFPKSAILMVDDEKDILDTYKKVLRNNGMNNLLLCQDSRKVMKILAEESVSMILLDLFMPHLSGEELLKKIRQEYPDIPVIIITGSNRVETAVECMKYGAKDYIVKPVEMTRLLSSIMNTLEILELQNEVRTLKKEVLSDDLKNPHVFSGIISINSKMKSIFKYTEAIADTLKPVLITGESGAGKDLLARVIHTLSNAKGEYVAVNAAGLDDTIFSDTLFGHKKGAYTGAVDVRNGLIEQAQGGTLFLDEIGDLECGSQVKLLRLLQEHEYYKLGSDVIRKSYARIIAATSADLPQKLEQGSFRKELYYRLMTHHIHIPPLRERMEDVPLLVEHFVNKSAAALDMIKLKIPDELIRLLLHYHFPGNVRELEAMIFNAVNISKGDTIELSFFKEYLDKHYDRSVKVETDKNKVVQIVTTYGRLPTLKETEEYLYNSALIQSNGNQSTAAQILGVSQPTLSRYFKKR
jgi:DNA-binding NtrC family response regulator